MPSTSEKVQATSKQRFCVPVVFLIGIVLSFRAHAQLFTDSFDAGLSAWTATGGWAVNAAGAATDSVSANYANNTDTALTLSAPLDLATATHPALRFVHRYAVEPFYDAATVEA